MSRNSKGNKRICWLTGICKKLNPLLGQMQLIFYFCSCHMLPLLFPAALLETSFFGYPVTLYPYVMSFNYTACLAVLSSLCFCLSPPVPISYSQQAPAPGQSLSTEKAFSTPHTISGVLQQGLPRSAFDHDQIVAYSLRSRVIKNKTDRNHH